MPSRILELQSPVRGCFGEIRQQDSALATRDTAIAVDNVSGDEGEGSGRRALVEERGEEPDHTDDEVVEDPPKIKKAQAAQEENR